jgi:hypothetical protein
LIINRKGPNEVLKGGFLKNFGIAIINIFILFYFLLPILGLTSPFLARATQKKSKSSFLHPQEQESDQSSSHPRPPKQQTPTK